LGWKNSLQTSPLFVAERVAMHSLFFITSCWRSQKNTAIPSSRQGVDLAGAKLGARAAGSAPDGTCAGAPLA
jgi:hypothetical protein